MHSYIHIYLYQYYNTDNTPPTKNRITHNNPTMAIYPTIYLSPYQYRGCEIWNERTYMLGICWVSRVRESESGNIGLGSTCPALIRAFLKSYGGWFVLGHSAGMWNVGSYIYPKFSVIFTTMWDYI